MRRTRQNHSAAFKAKLALVKGAEAVFDGKKPDKPDIDVQRLHAKIGELALANYFLEVRSLKRAS
jgi:hypothetical protein